ncbi:MAG: HAD-IA family hydrolase, partial [Candidatus Limnocylindrales bacterium]
RWRDAVTARMAEAASYVSYEGLIVAVAAEIGLPPSAASQLFDLWLDMAPWPDAGALARLGLPYAFVTNSSTELAAIAARRSGLQPAFVLPAEESGWYKPHPAAYREACRRLGSPPQRTLFVAGAPYDAKGARRAGLQVVLVVRRSDQRLPAAGIRIVSSLEEIVVGINPSDP